MVVSWDDLLFPSAESKMELNESRCVGSVATDSRVGYVSPHKMTWRREIAIGQSSHRSGHSEKLTTFLFFFGANFLRFILQVRPVQSALSPLYSVREFRVLSSVSRFFLPPESSPLLSILVAIRVSPT